LLQITQRLNNEIRDSSDASNSAVCNAVCSVLALRTLQSELVDLYGQFGVETSTLVAPQMFRQFVGAILDIIAGHPLEFPKDIAQRRGSLRKIYDSACRVARDDPRWIVTHCSVTNELSDEQLVFYGVPNGTYIWQIGMAAGYFLCGLL